MIPILRLSFLTAGLFAAAAVASAAIERTVEKTFPVSGVGLLRVETQGGAIEVVPTGGSAVKVVLRQKIRADTDAGPGSSQSPWSQGWAGTGPDNNQASAAPISSPTGTTA